MVNAVNRGSIPGIRNRKKSKNYDTFKDAFTIVAQYKRYLGETQGVPPMSPSISKIYYNELKDALYFGSDEEIAENYFEAYNNEVFELITNKENIETGLRPQGIANEAHRNIMQSINTMNPLRFDERKKYSLKSELDAYKAWEKINVDEEGRNKVRKADNYFQYQVKRKLNKIINNPAYRKKYVDYFKQINHVFTSTYYMMDVFKNTKPITKD